MSKYGVISGHLGTFPYLGTFHAVLVCSTSIIHWCPFCVFIVNFEEILHIVSVIEFEQLLGDTAQKMKFSIIDFFCKSEQIRTYIPTFRPNVGKNVLIWSDLLKKTLMGNFNFLCSVRGFRYDFFLFSFPQIQKCTEPFQTSMMDLFAKIVFKSR